MRTHTLIVDHPYYDRLTIDLRAGMREALADALEYDHPCEDASCDIATAAANGYVLVAAWFLSGATDCETVEAVLAHYRAYGRESERAELGTHAYDCADWHDWKAHHDAWARYCDACGSVTYAEVNWEPDYCGNCHADLPTDSQCQYCGRYPGLHLPADDETRGDTSLVDPQWDGDGDVCVDCFEENGETFDDA